MTPTNEIFSGNETLTLEDAERQELGTVNGEPVQPPQPEIDPDIDRQMAEAAQETEALRRQSDQMREQLVRHDERQRAIAEARKSSEGAAREWREAAQRPNPDIDPVGAKLWETERRLQE